MGLETYREKRDFKRTQEPRGRQKRRTGYEFVVQKHDARNLHYDFRLELDGVLLSWAVPKGPSLDPKVKRLAMQTEDHPLEYGGFEGIIPEGEYGGGTVLLWDRGTWKPEGDAAEMYRRGRLNFELQGEKLHGSFHLVRTASRGKPNQRQWLLFKSNDAEARPGSDAEILEAQPNSVASGRDLAGIAGAPAHVWTSKKVKAPARSKASPRTRADTPDSPPDAAPGRPAALPEFIEPELATLTSSAPEGDEWLHEIKLDGYRLLARIDGGKATLKSRRGNDWTARLPSIQSAVEALSLDSGLLDGELVMLGENGVSDFQLLQNSLEGEQDARLVYFVFDALFLNGFDLRQLPLIERKAKLRAAVVAANNPHVRFSDHIQGNGPAFFEQACKRGLEGIVCKRADAPYTSGRGRTWLKVKCLSVQEFAIGGFTEPTRSRQHLGALLLGVRKGKKLMYAGKVGTGFTRASLAALAQRLEPLEQSEPPFENPPRGAERRGVHWVAPELVAQIAFSERTQDGLLRHASFQGLRDDKTSAEVNLEQPQPAPPTRASRSSKPRSSKQGDAPSATAKTKSSAKSTPQSKSTAKSATKAKSSHKPKARSASSATSTADALPLDLDLSRLEITHPDRILYPDQGITKRDLMLHYARVARWMLPHVVRRPLMLVRCPEGEGQQCFHQKHPSAGMPKAVQQVVVQQKNGPEAQLMIADVEGLLGLVQMGALEIHVWGCHAETLDTPDQLVFDLDPDVGLAWERVQEAAHALRQMLEERGLPTFLLLTGGKGVHVVVPVKPTTPWEEAKQFSKRIADALVQAAPTKYLATMTKQKRQGKIFLDYLRNGRGATFVCPFSTRARSGAPVAVPISWAEFDAGIRPGQVNLQNLSARLESLKEDPWRDFGENRSVLPKS